MKTVGIEAKVALVTGAASGIGRAIALQLAAEGARVVVSDLDEPGGCATVAAIERDGGDAIFVAADTARPDHHQTLIARTLERYGALHIAVNNAGIGGARAKLGEYPIEGWDRVIAVNLSGVFYGMREQIPAMRRAGSGAIVNISSILGQVGFEGSAAYTAAKHGLVGLTRSAALEYAAEGIRVNVVGPGFIRTPMVENGLSPQELDGVARLHPIGRLGLPSEVAELVVWLASDKASFVTGSYYAVDGGYLAR
jgi:NAD(P)-dependent dehydrogenase (short-subunit alcohol dehydrogenase family)